MKTTGYILLLINRFCLFAIPTLINVACAYLIKDDFYFILFLALGYIQAFLLAVFLSDEYQNRLKAFWEMKYKSLTNHA